MLGEKIMVVYQCRISGGTDRLLVHLIKNWPDKNTIWSIYLHYENTGIELFQKLLSSQNIEIIPYFIGKNEFLSIDNQYIYIDKQKLSIYINIKSNYNERKNYGR